VCSKSLTIHRAKDEAEDDKMDRLLLKSSSNNRGVAALLSIYFEGNFSGVSRVSRKIG
jgi:hypothetical protein